MTTRLAALACLAVLGGPGAGTAAAQPLAPDPNAWTVEYSISGGFAGFVHRITVHDTGDLEVIDANLGSVRLSDKRSTTGGVEGIQSMLRYHVRGRAPEELMTHIRAALEHLSEPRPARAVPDVPGSTLFVIRGGHTYAPASPGDLVSRLEAAFDAAVTAGVAGTWSESGWKLCKPAETLPRADVDPPIETLELRADGTFTATWPPGIHSSHSALREEGTWRINPRIATFHIDPAPTSPTRHLRRFGWFSIDENTLTLSNIWFGTVQAPQTPDICALTFTRKSAP